jgi:DnaJ-domain-containing protein 1
LNTSGSVLILVIAICLVVGYAIASALINLLKKRRKPVKPLPISEEDCRRILNVSWRASEFEIDAAYRQLRSMYEPRNFAHLDTEFSELAQRRTDALIQAYDTLRALRAP